MGAEDGAIEIVTRAQAKALGAKRYFTGKPCPNGHTAERYTGTSNCVECLAEVSRSKKKKEYDKEYYRANKERILARDRKYYEENKEKISKTVSAWAERNKDKVRAIKSSYKARRRTQEEGGATSAEVADWLSKQAFVCYWCSCACKDNYHIDHYVPLSRGGKHETDNFVISCPTCNVSKNAKDPYDFARQVGRLF